MTVFGDVEIRDDLSMVAPPHTKFTPAQALDFAECISRIAFRQMLKDEAEKYEKERQH